MYDQTQNKLILQAEKQLKSRTSHYRIFDMSRGSMSDKLSKKSGNYVGKLRSNRSRTEYVMISSNRERSEVGAVMFFDRESESLVRSVAPSDNLMNQLTVCG